MLHLHKASRNLTSVIIHSSNRIQSSSQLISRCNFSNYNVLQHQKQLLCRSQFLGVEKYRKTLQVPSALSGMNFYSTKGNKDEEADAIEIEMEEPEFIQKHLPATVAIPEVWPFLPCIATSRNPVFPRFMKIIEASSGEHSLNRH